MLIALWLCGTLRVSAGWYVEAGPWVRGDMSVEVHGGSRAAESGVLLARPGSFGSLPMPMAQVLQDDGTTPVLRLFNDGFVGPSGWEWANIDGITQFWGYHNEEQYDSGFNTLTFTRDVTDVTTAGRSQTRITHSPAGWEDRKTMSGSGAQATLGRYLTRHESFAISLQGTIGWLNGMNAHFKNQPTYRQEQERRTYSAALTQMESWQYTYDTLNNPVFPAAPYEMTDPQGIGPMIADTPESFERTSSSSSVVDTLTGVRRQSAVSHVDLQVESSLLVLNAGPRLLWKPHQKVHVFVQPGLTLNFLDAEARRSEAFSLDNGTVLGVWNDSKDEQTWLWGAGISFGAIWRASENFYFLASGGYDYVERHTFTVGPDRVYLDLSGYQVDIAVGIPFGK